MTDTKTCRVCGRTGVRNFIRDDQDGQQAWRCASWAACRERVWEAERANTPVKVDELTELREMKTRVTALAEKWNTAEDLVNGGPSIVARAFASQLLAAIEGEEAS